MAYSSATALARLGSEPRTHNVYPIFYCRQPSVCDPYHIEEKRQTKMVAKASQFRGWWLIQVEVL